MQGENPSSSETLNQEQGDVHILIPHEEPPRASKELQAGESVVKRKLVHSSVSNVEDSYQFDEFKWHGSVIPTTLAPAIVFTLWATLWTLLYQLIPMKNIAMSPTLITILSVVIGLLLVFRTNTAYDRYWEARRLWGTLFSHIRNLARITWIGVKHDGKKELQDKLANINLLLAFAVACKHYLRFEKGHHYEDLYSLLVHLPEYKPGQYHADRENLPLEISFHISCYNNRCRAKENPFGYDDNDLRMDLFCDKLKNELEQLVQSPVAISVDDWTVPIDISDYSKLKHVSSHSH
ncbi:hypothetical protein HK103_000217 [Boothiomyces macroporosus]|uniref:Uncharacterized protein n=1 Tax=Boothiomyces macroporosus TaxID=261099 RepID=A0AAD5Y5I4_9FUNG|nr:hypothetical protein HK103_000217 [Boothiomyces macroporosus]